MFWTGGVIQLRTRQTNRRHNMSTDLYCDRCGAIAKARFLLDSGDLVFCGHHGREYNMALTECGAIFDVKFATDNDPELQMV